MRKLPNLGDVTHGPWSHSANNAVRVRPMPKWAFKLLLRLKLNIKETTLMMSPLDFHLTVLMYNQEDDTKIELTFTQMLP